MPSVRPGQVYWNGKRQHKAVVYRVDGGVVKSVILADRGRPAHRTVTWRNGVPRGYFLTYDPPC